VSSTSRQAFAEQVLRDLHDAVTPNNVANIELWTYQEQSNQSAWNRDYLNPLGVRNDAHGNVAPYSSFGAAAQGTASTLENGLYNNVLHDLTTNASTVRTSTDIMNSPWSGNYYRSRGLRAFLTAAGGSLKGSTTNVPGASTSPAPNAKTLSGIQGLQGINGVNPGGFINGWSPPNPLSAAANIALTPVNAATSFVAKFSIVVLGLGLFGLGVYKVVEPKLGAAAPTIAKAVA
jgi:hypothetical protein